jgi:hypothetical protein
MDFLNHREGGMVFLFSRLHCILTLLSKYLRGCLSLHKRLCEFEEIEISKQSCDGDL